MLYATGACAAMGVSGSRGMKMNINHERGVLRALLMLIECVPLPSSTVLVPALRLYNACDNAMLRALCTLDLQELHGYHMEETFSPKRSKNIKQEDRV